ncbi:hypothetical protein HCN44_003653 [Aphidius gifuensis]|uniref:Uncharacterized protein n=1 Tax=Aphidius gifuensis TaxID=684658 RepID=A0A834XLY1_APHGI|nr:myb-like protein X [Aphidius gifuensis]KAF7987790.1 hypothetical protein HCN44_003653 [Aphidius gifuensis]
MSSRASTVLLRLKQMDKKYKSNVEKINDKFSDLSALSSEEVTEKSQIILKPRLSIKLPDTFVENVDSFSSNSENSIKSVKVVVDNDKSSTVSSISHVISNKNTSKDEETVVELSDNKITINNDTTIKEINTEDDVVDEESIDEDIEEVIESNTSKSQRNIDEEKTFVSVDETFEDEDDGSQEYSDDSFDSVTSVNKTKYSESTKDVTNKNLQIENKANSLVTCSDSIDSRVYFEEVNSKTELDESHSIGHDFQEDNNKNQIKFDDSYSIKTHAENKNENSINNEKQFIENKKLIKSPSKENSNEIKNLDKSCVEEKNIKIDNSSSKISSISFEKISETSITDSTKSSSKSLIKSDKKKLIKLDEDKKKEIKSKNISQLTCDSKKKSLKLQKLSKQSREEDEYKKNKNKEKRSLSIIRHLKQIEEERLRLLVWPTNFVCSNNSKTEILKPLDPPKIPDFIKPVTNSTHKNEDINIKILKSRIFDIQQWTKDQYSIYKDQCDLAAAINSTYKPPNLQEAEKAIQQLKCKTRLYNKQQ